MLSFVKTLFFLSFFCGWSLALVAPVARNEKSGPRRTKRAVDFHVPNCNNFTNGIRVNTSDRLKRLRYIMTTGTPEFAAYIVPTDDEHQSEYVSDYDKRREYISGLTASAGTAVILQTAKAAVWTDSRYYIQAEEELDCNWELMKSGRDETPGIAEWLISNLQRGSRVGIVAKFVSQNSWLTWQKELDTAGIQLVDDQSSLIDKVWPPRDRPTEPSAKVFVHDIKYAGKSWEDKVRDIRREMEHDNIDRMIVTSLEEVAWLLNLRGGDIPFVPVFKSYAYLTAKEVRLYTKMKKITSEVKKHLNVTGCAEISDCIKVDIRNYDEIFNDARRSTGKILISDSASYAIYSSVFSDQRSVGTTYTRKMMITKNPVEIQGMKNAMLKDSVALVDFLAMLEEEIQRGEHWDEIKASKVLEKYRSEQDLFKGNSFDAISSFGPNGANNHYTPTAATNRTIDTSSLYLLDSGGQYLDGTTDITRTMHYGTPTDFQKEAYTRVLMGVIDLSSIVFAKGVRDSEIDFVTRRALYEIGLDYGHGTGHGVGSYLNVHEYPPLISYSSGAPFEPGMFFSIEPGYYEEGDFGIRLETLYQVVKAKTKYNFNNGSYYKFEPVVYVPFEPKLIKVKLLSEAQIKWLNDYNVKVIQTVGIELRRQKRPRGVQWIMERTQEIRKNKNTGYALLPSISLLTIAIFVSLRIQRFVS